MRPALLLIAACSAPTVYSPSNVAAPATLASLPVIELHMPAHARHDCRLSQVVNARWGTQPVTSCGAVDANDLRARVAAKDCAVAAIVAHRPFVYELAGGGIDSEVARAWIGVVERGRLVTYVASFDRDPCGLGCPEDGGTVIERCRELQPDDQDGSFACTGSESVASCSFGK